MYEDNAADFAIGFRRPTSNACAYCEASTTCDELERTLRVATVKLKECQNLEGEKLKRNIIEKANDLRLENAFINRLCPCSSMAHELENLIREANKLLKAVYRSRETCEIFNSSPLSNH